MSALWVDEGELKDLRTELSDHPDVGPDDRIKALAQIAALKLTALVGVAACVIGGFGAAIWLMLALLPWFDSPSAAAWFAMLGVAITMGGPAVALQLGRRFQRRALLRAVRRAADRRSQLVLHSVGSSVPVAVSSTQRAR